MDTGLVVLISVLVGAIALGFYMNWFGLWVSKEEMNDEIESTRERMERFEKQEQMGPPDCRDAVAGASPTLLEDSPRPSEPEYEPVHGWTRSQRDDYLARNPTYRPTYDAELQKHQQA